MRGSDTRTGDLFSYVDLEKRVPAKHPLRPVRRVVNDVLACPRWRFFRGLCGRRPAFDTARAASAGAAAAGILHDPIGTPADGAARLQSSLPLVRRARR
jgi:hypothetical protein